MKANEILEELSIQQRIHGIEQAIRSIREEKQKGHMDQAVEELYEDYKND